MSSLTADDLKKIKQIELEMLDEFLRLVHKHDLTYFLTGGTCLGAVRHGGFIPWDDDIDIAMPRDSYERFQTIAQQELDERYVFQSMDTEPECGLVFGKIRAKNTILSECYSCHIPMSQGVWIDIFPVDNIPDENALTNRQYARVHFLRNLYIVKAGYKLPEGKGAGVKAAYYLAKALCAPIPLSHIITKLEKSMTQHDDVETGRVFVFGTAYSPEKERYPRVNVFPCGTLSFEGRLCSVPHDVDAYLTQLYGNYMELPPIEKRTGGMHSICEFADNRAQA